MPSRAQHSWGKVNEQPTTAPLHLCHQKMKNQKMEDEEAKGGCPTKIPMLYPVYGPGTVSNWKTSLSEGEARDSQAEGP